MSIDTEEKNEEFKAAPTRQGHKGHSKQKAPNAMTPSNANNGGQPYVIIEGPEPSQDLSYKWVAKYENVAEIEKGVALPEF